MSQKLVGAQAPFKMLIANLRGAGDPSRGPSGNPEKLRSTYATQNFVEIGGRGPEVVSDPRNPGLGTRIGHTVFSVDGVSVHAAGTITVDSNTFSGPTWVQLGQYFLTSGEDFTVGTGAVQATGQLTVAISPSTATITIGGVALTATAGARTPGSNDYDGTAGSLALIAADIIAAINDAANDFDGLVLAASGGGAIVNLTAVPVGSLGNAVTVVSSNGDVTVLASPLSGGSDAGGVTATNLAAAISALPEYSATALDEVVTVVGPYGVLGNEAAFLSGGSSPQNFVFSPTSGSMSGAEPSLGAPEIS